MKKMLRSHEFYLFLIIILISFVITMINPAFFTLDNLFSLLRTHSWEGILAVGFFLVLLSGGIDVSFTAVAVSCMYISVYTMLVTGINNIALAFTVAMVLGIIMGAINGVFIAIFEIPTLITTLGTLTAFHGALMSYAQWTTRTVISDPPSAVKEFGKINIFTITRSDGSTIGFSVFALIFIVVALGTWLMLKYTTLGRSIRAIGGNIEAARRAGFNIVRTQFFIYCYVGCLAGLAGLMFGTYIRYINPLFIVGSELTIIAAVVLGGASIMGGKGSIIGTVLGITMLTIIRTSFVLMKVPSYYERAVTGLIIIASVAITAYRERLSRRQARVIKVE